MISEGLYVLEEEAVQNGQKSGVLSYRTLSRSRSSMDQMIADTSHEDEVRGLVIFGILGFCSGFFWEAMMNCLPTICFQMFPELKGISEVITVSLNIGILLAACAMTVACPLRLNVLKVGIIIQGSCAVFLAWICWGLRHSERGKLPLMLVSFVGGVTSGLVESVSFAYATCLNDRNAGSFSIGFGLSGIVSFFFWMLFSRVCFPISRNAIHTETSRLKSLYLEQILTILVSVISLFAVKALESMKTFKRCNDRGLFKKQHSIYSSGSGASDEFQGWTEGPSSEHWLTKSGQGYSSPSSNSPYTLWQVVKKTGAHQFHLGFLLFITFTIMPNLVPIGLPFETPREKDILTGVFQVSDFLGRYFAMIPSLLIREKFLTALNYGRGALLVIAVWAIFDPAFDLIGDFWRQVIYLAVCGVTNGWFLTLFLMYLGRPLKRDDDKGRACAFSVLTQLTGLVLGLFAAAGIKHVLQR